MTAQNRPAKEPAVLSPFPGLDPYREAPAVWPDFHGRFTHDLREGLFDRLRKDYDAVVRQQDRPIRILAVDDWSLSAAKDDGLQASQAARFGLARPLRRPGYDGPLPTALGIEQAAWA